MKKTTPTGDANRAQTLQALRAGPMTTMEMTERWPFGARYAEEMKRAGLVELVEDEWRITPAGRAACPFRNPQAATAAAPEVFQMPVDQGLTYKDVLDAIKRAGPSGITRGQLMKVLDAETQQEIMRIDAHVSYLYKRTTPPAITKPSQGGFVAVEHARADSEIGQKTASTATDASQAEFAPVAGEPPQPGEVSGPVGTDIHGISLAIGQIAARLELPTTSLAAQMAQIGGALPAIVEDIRLDDPDTVEFAIYSSGGLDIFSEDCAITLDRPVLAKLRRFLGLFQGEVA